MISESTLRAAPCAVEIDLGQIVVHGVYEYIGADQWLRYAETRTLPAPF